jgi:hypothetical protein
MTDDDLPTIISACSCGDVTEIGIFSGDGETLAEYEVPRALLDVDALAAVFTFVFGEREAVV